MPIGGLTVTLEELLPFLISAIVLLVVAVVRSAAKKVQRESKREDLILDLQKEIHLVSTNRIKDREEFLVILTESKDECLSAIDNESRQRKEAEDKVSILQRTVDGLRSDMSRQANDKRILEQQNASLARERDIVRETVGETQKQILAAIYNMEIIFTKAIEAISKAPAIPHTTDEEDSVNDN